MSAWLTLSISRGSLQQHGQPDLLQKVATVAGCRSIHTHADVDIAIQQSPHWRNAFKCSHTSPSGEFVNALKRCSCMSSQQLGESGCCTACRPATGRQLPGLEQHLRQGEDLTRGSVRLQCHCLQIAASHSCRACSNARTRHLDLPTLCFCTAAAYESGTVKCLPT